MRKTNGELFDQWRHLIGLENPEGKKLTKSMLKKWTKSPEPHLVCLYCGEIVTMAQAKAAQGCPKCREYKGVQPCIAGWSELPKEP